MIEAGYFEKAYSKMVDRELAKRRAIVEAPLTIARKRDCLMCGRFFMPATQLQLDCKLCKPEFIISDLWEPIIALMGDRWMTTSAIAKRMNLWPTQVQAAFDLNRERLEKRVLVYRNGTEWRVKGLPHPRPKA